MFVSRPCTQWSSFLSPLLSGLLLLVFIHRHIYWENSLPSIHRVVFMQAQESAFYTPPWSSDAWGLCTPFCKFLPQSLVFLGLSLFILHHPHFFWNLIWLKASSTTWNPLSISSPVMALEFQNCITQLTLWGFSKDTEMFRAGPLIFSKSPCPHAPQPYL